MELIKLGDLWIRWNRKHGVPQLKQIMSWSKDAGYYPVAVSDMATASKRPTTKFSMKSGANMIVNLNGKVLSTKGMTFARDLNIGDKLITTDRYTGFTGSRTIHRVSARLRNHGVEHTIDDPVLTFGDTTMLCKPFETSGVVHANGMVVVGQNNYAEYLDSIGYSAYYENEIVWMFTKPLSRYTMAVQLEDSDTLVLGEGLVMGGSY